MGDRAIDPNVKSVKTMYCAWCGWATKERSNSSSKPSHEDSREARTSLIAMEVAARTIAAAVKYTSWEASIRTVEETWWRLALLVALLQQKLIVKFRLAKMGCRKYKLETKGHLIPFQTRQSLMKHKLIVSKGFKVRFAINGHKL
jgi:hypothetical protein